ncbi:MAG: aldo/keto reductase, partial [Candidatus Omnitrophica bacterium]|nr:aldo/keto reductase [Candidatus Omnitrophota bacterium]
YPAFALRQTGLEESDQIKGQLVDALTNSAPSSSTTVSHTLATISAGMEEKSLREMIQEELTQVRPQLAEKLTERHWEVLERTETLGDAKRAIRGQVEKRKLDSTAGVILGAVQRAKTHWRQQEEAKRNIPLKKRTKEQRLEGETQPSQPLPGTQQTVEAVVELAAQYQDLLAKILTEKDETAAKSLALDRLDKWIHSAEEVLPTIEPASDKGLTSDILSRLRQVKETVAYTQDRQQWEGRIINLDEFLNPQLFLPYGGVWVFLRIEGGRHELIFGPPAAWWRIQAGGKEILLVVWPEGLTTAYSHVKGVLILDVGEIHRTVQNGIRWWKKAGHPIGSVSAFYQRYLRELLHEELGHAADAVVFEEFGEGEEAVRQAVIPNSDLESFIRQDPPDNIENDIPEVAAYFRHLIFADSPRGMLEATTAVLEAAANPSDRLHHWAGRFVRQQVMKALTVDSTVGEAEVDLFVKVKTMPVAEIRRKVRDRMSTNLNLPTEGGIFPHLSEDGGILSEHPAIVQMRDTLFKLMEPMIRAGAEEERGVVRDFGKTGLKFFVLGVGTIWFGRQWPPGNASYVEPTTEEIRAYLDEAFARMGNQEGVVMIDIAAAYGFSEERIGQYLREHPARVPYAFVATKWGEEFDVASGTSRLDHSLQNLRASVARSLSRLGKVDLLYIHGTTVGVLKDREVMEEMRLMKLERYGGIHAIGASISDENVLSTAIQDRLLQDLDVVQMPAPLFLKRPELADELRKQGLAVVLNSPIRRGDQRPPQEIFKTLLDQPASTILIGTRHHLRETVGYVEEWRKSRDVSGAPGAAGRFEESGKGTTSRLVKWAVGAVVVGGGIYGAYQLTRQDKAPPAVPPAQQIAPEIPVGREPVPMKPAPPHLLDSYFRDLHELSTGSWEKFDELPLFQGDSGIEGVYPLIKNRGGTLLGNSFQQDLGLAAVANSSTVVVVHENPLVTEVALPLFANLVGRAETRREFLSVLLGVELSDGDVNRLLEPKAVKGMELEAYLKATLREITERVPLEKRTAWYQEQVLKVLEGEVFARLQRLGRFKNEQQFDEIKGKAREEIDRFLRPDRLLNPGLTEDDLPRQGFINFLENHARASWFHYPLGSWLSDEGHYKRLRAHFRRTEGRLIAGITMSLTDIEGMKKVGDWLRRHDREKVSVLSLWNTGDQIGPAGSRAMYRFAFSQLPVREDAQLIFRISHILVVSPMLALPYNMVRPYYDYVVPEDPLQRNDQGVIEHFFGVFYGVLPEDRERPIYDNLLSNLKHFFETSPSFSGPTFRKYEMSYRVPYRSRLKHSFWTSEAGWKEYQIYENLLKQIERSEKEVRQKRLDPDGFTKWVKEWARENAPGFSTDTDYFRAVVWKLVGHGILQPWPEGFWSRPRKPTPQLVREYTAALVSANPHVRRTAGESLSRIGPQAKEAVPALIKVLQDDVPVVRETSAMALGRIGPEAKEALPHLNRALEREKDFTIRETIQEAISQIQKKSGLEEQLVSLPSVQVLSAQQGVLPMRFIELEEQVVTGKVVGLVTSLMRVLSPFRNTTFPVGADQDRSVLTIVDTTTDERGNPSPERAALSPYLPRGTVAIVRSYSDLLAAESLAGRVSGARVISLDEMPGRTEAERFETAIRRVISGIVPGVGIQVLSGRQPSQISQTLSSFQGKIEYVAPATLRMILEALRAGQDLVALFESGLFQSAKDSWDTLAGYL